MKKPVVLFLFGLFALAASAQQRLPVEEAAKHEGDSVTICAKVFGGKYLEKSGVTLLNVGGKYPDAPLTLVIKDENRAAFSNKPEEYYNGKQVCFIGKIRMFKGKPEVELYSEKAISLTD